MKNDIQIFKKILKYVPEPFNFYLVYKGIKKGYVCYDMDNKILKNKSKIIRLCKDLHLSYKFQDTQGPVVLFVSNKKLPNVDNLFDIPYIIQKVTGYPKGCYTYPFDRISSYSSLLPYRNEIFIQYQWKKDDTLHSNTIYGFTSSKKHMKYLLQIQKKIEKVIKNDLAPLFQTFSIESRIIESKSKRIL